MEHERIALVARDYKLTLVELPVPVGDEPGAYYVTVATFRNNQGYQIPSHKTLADARSTLLAIGITPHFILVNNAIDQSEATLRTSMIATYPDVIRNLFLSFNEGKLIAWLDTKRRLEDDETHIIENHVRRFAEPLRARSISIAVMSDEEIATNTETLAAIRRHAPVSCDALKAALEQRGFVVPSIDWINRRFDNLRKAGLIVRLADHTYVLSAEALHRLGTSKGRQSADVSRLLALARGG